MLDILTQKLGMEPWVATYVLLPVLIFMARILDVSIGTIRVILIMQGNKRLAPLLGFIESFIWLVAISQIIRNIDNMFSYVAFAGGYATGTFIGLYLEEKLAFGKVLVRVITKKEANELIEYLVANNFHFTNIPAEGRYGPVNVIFSVIKRDRLHQIIGAVKKFNPKAFYTIETIKGSSEYQFTEPQRRRAFFGYLSLKRK